MGSSPKRIGCANFSFSTADLDEGKRNLDSYGVTVHKSFLSMDLLKALRDRLEEQAEVERKLGVSTFFQGAEYRSHIGRPDGLPYHQRVTFLVNKGQVFIDLAKHPIALAYASHVLQAPFNIGAQAGVIIRNGAPAQVIHNDQQHLPFPTPKPISINIMVALGDYSEDMGATRVILGSHRREAPDLNLLDVESETVPVAMEAGDAAIWESRVWHGQGASKSPQPRYSIATMYLAHFMKPPDYHPTLIHDEVYERLTEEERGLYDFNYTTYLGRIGPRNAADRRQNVGDPVPYIPILHRDISQ